MTTISASLEKPVDKKKLTLKKTNDRSGLILKLNQLEGQAKTLRFIYASFNRTGCILAASTLLGNIIVLNFAENKFWLLSCVSSCTVLNFSHFSDTEILAGTRDCEVRVFDVDSGAEITTLKSHTYPVNEISFSATNHCLTASSIEAIVWEVKSWSKIQLLTLEGSSLKHITFVPVSGDILACFHDDVIHVWKCGIYDNFKYISPHKWNKVNVKSIAFTRNGRCVLIAGHSSSISVFFLESWIIYQTIHLPHYIKSVKHIDFLPQPFDDGCNKLLCILAGHGVLYIYDMENNVMLTEIIAKREISKFYTSSGGKYLACVVCSGEILVYDVSAILYSEKRKSSTAVVGKTRSKLSKVSVKEGAISHEQMEEILDIEKLRAILKQYGQYPNKYRAKIWQHILQLHCNSHLYNVIVKHRFHSTFENLEDDYPLVNKLLLQNLKRLLNNLVTWCPFFAHVKYLPLFLFPFVKVFHVEPIICFEAVCTILINFCQHWFEYYPLPPMNVLGMIENVLLEHDPRLLDHLIKNDVTFNLYAWSLLKVAFSETLTAEGWLIFWDHVLSNEPAFLLMGVVAYNIVNRSVLLSLNGLSDFYRFFHSQNPLNLKQLIAKSYQLLENTSERNHPRKYLNSFCGLHLGKYPTFLDYPQSLIGYEDNELESLRNEEEILEIMKRGLSQRQLEIQSNEQSMDVREEQNKRLKELERIYHQKIAEEQARLMKEKKKLIEMQKRIQQEELEKLLSSRDKLLEKNVMHKCETLERLIKDVTTGKLTEELEMERAEAALLQQQKRLLEHKIQIEQLLQPATQAYTSHVVLQQQQKALEEDIKKVIEGNKTDSVLKRLNIATGLAAIEDLMEAAEIELAKEMADKYDVLCEKEAEDRIRKLQDQTETLQTEIFTLTALLERSKMSKGKKEGDASSTTASSGFKPPPPSNEEV